MKKMYYFPLESYAARYTRQLSAYKTGWYERKWLKHGVNFVRVDHQHPELYGPRIPADIETGVVLDATYRSIHCMQQIEYFLRYMINQVQTGDVLFFDDFWTPGAEAIKYALEMRGVKAHFAAYCWAQSVDEYDFLFAHRDWIRPIELGLGRGVYDTVFVANSLLKDRLIWAGVSHRKIKVVGLPFDTEEVLLHFSGNRTNTPKKNKVVFTSRLDWEKQPLYFLEVVEKVRAHPNCPSDLEFVVCSSHKGIKTNAPEVETEIRRANHEGTVKVKLGLSIAEYYTELAEAKVQFNCALQDWVSFTLLEAVTFGAFPVYPDFRSFPETLGVGFPGLYAVNNKVGLSDPPWPAQFAVDRIIDAVNDEKLFTPESMQSRMWIANRYNDSWFRMAHDLGVLPRHLAGEDVSTLSRLNVYAEENYGVYLHV